MNQRYKQLCKAQKTGNPQDRRKYKILRNEVNRIMKKAETEYWKDTVQQEERIQRLLEDCKANDQERKEQ